MKFKIMLNSVQDAEEFVKAASLCNGEVDLHSGVVYLDGKSLLGVISMGIKREMNVHFSNESIEQDMLKVVEKFAIA